MKEEIVFQGKAPRGDYQKFTIEEVTRHLPQGARGVYDMQVSHDDDCPMLHDKGFCDCEAEIKVTRKAKS